MITDWQKKEAKNLEIFSRRTGNIFEIKVLRYDEQEKFNMPKFVKDSGYAIDETVSILKSQMGIYSTKYEVTEHYTKPLYKNALHKLFLTLKNKPTLEYLSRRTVKWYPQGTAPLKQHEPKFLVRAIQLRVPIQDINT